jgi:type III secretion protein R
MSEHPIAIIGVIVVLAALPFLAIVTTAFVKIAVALTILRAGFGPVEIPPMKIVTAMALILALFVMYPIGVEIYGKTEKLLNKPMEGSLFSPESMNMAVEFVDAAEKPMKRFLIANSDSRVRLTLDELQARYFQDAGVTLPDKENFAVIIPSFLISELTRAFQIGFLILLPFFILDLLIGSILASLNFMSLSTGAVSLPFKLLLFLSVNGWTLITRGLLMGYHFG